MKKLFLLALLVFCGSMIYAQRSIDLQATVLSPADGATITNNMPFTLSIQLQNNGADNAMVGDTIYVLMLLDNSQSFGLYSLVIADSNYLKKDSVRTFTINGYSLQFTSAYNGSHTLCTYALLSNGSTITDPSSANNNDCNNVTLAGGTSGIGGINQIVATDVKSFPVPATTKMDISYTLVKENRVGIKIYDISGRELMNVLDEKQGAGAQMVSVNTSELKTGVYFYELNIGGYISRTKFVVAN